MDVRGTLMYAGAFEGRARLDTENPSNSHLALEPHEMLIRDVRPRRQSYTLDRHGFEYVKHWSEAVLDPQLFASCNSHERLPTGISARYSDEVIELLRDYTNAAVVMPQIGSFLARASNRAKKKTWAGTAGLVHLDYTETSANQLMNWTLEAHGVSAPSHSHFAFIQTWRAVSPAPQDNSLCICDGGSVRAEDAVPVDAIMGSPDEPGKCFEFRICKYGEAHGWYYLSSMEPDDVLLFKGFDSRYPRAMNAMHSAFDNPLTGPDTPARHSIEARFLAFYE